MKRLSFLFLALAFAFSLAWAAPSSGAAKLKVGMIPIVDCIQIFVAKEKGFFAEKGLDVELSPMAGGAVILPAVAGGSLDIGFTSVISTIVSADKGFDFVVVADGAYDSPRMPENSVVVVRTDAGIRSPKELVGKKVAINTLRQVSDLYIMEMVKRDGGDPKKIIWVEIPFPQMLPTLLKKQVDAANLVEPFYTQAKDNPEIKLLTPLFSPVRHKAIVAHWVTTKKWADAHADLVEAFALALKKATDFINANEAEARMVIPKYTRIAPEIAKKMYLKDMGKSVDIAELQWTADRLLELGWIDKRLDVRTLVYKTAQ